MPNDRDTELIELREQFRSLIARVAELEQRNRELEERNGELTAENGRLKELLYEKGSSKGSKAPKFSENYSVEQNQSKGKSKRGKQATGRRPEGDKLSLVQKEVDLYPVGAERSQCRLEREQRAWRLEDGRAIYVSYRLYVEEGVGLLPSVPGLRNSRSEYGIEIILTVAFLHYWIGISLDHVCGVLRFFTGLGLSKSQANSLLNQLSQDWVGKNDCIAELIALQMVLYIDETGWRVGKHACYTWAFSSMLYVFFKCGVSRQKTEAEAVLKGFEGTGVSDDYAAYKYLFKIHQLCWAHLLRKAIKLTLQHPEQKIYQTFLQDLYDIYQDAVGYQKDRRLTVGRPLKVERLKTRILNLCNRASEQIVSEAMPAHEQTFLRLQRELVKGLDALFVFVAQPEVEATNNRSERNVRREAEVRKGGRTSKSDAGAKRRGIIMTVLATLDLRFPSFTLEHLVAEVMGWIENGVSIFQIELQAIMQANPPPNPTTVEG
jgi:transposase